MKITHNTKGRLHFTYCLLLFFVIYSGKAQITPVNTVLPSPNAANLVSIPSETVNKSMGALHVGVPIQNIKLRENTLPIFLDYNATGVIPDNHPGWVGQNWSLVAGGVINRVVKQFPDETNNSVMYREGYFFQHGLLNSGSWSDSATITDNGAPNYEELFFHYGYGYHDSQPDEFSFNFLNYQGKFFFDQSGNIRVQSEEPLKVIFDTTDFIDPFLKLNPTTQCVTDYINKTFNKFTIIDNKGYQYVFGTEEAIEYSDAIYSTVQLSYAEHARGAFFLASAWYLKRIIAPDGAKLAEFNYTRGPFITSMNTSAFREETTMSPGGTSTLKVLLARTGKIVSPVYLRQIDIPENNLTVKFSASKSTQLTVDSTYIFYADEMYYNDPSEINRFIDLLNLTSGINFFGESIPSASTRGSKIQRFMWPKLDKVIFTDTAGSYIREYNFCYNNTTDKRLQLLQVIVGDTSSSNHNRYQFNYDTLSLPRYLLAICDAGGYYNGNLYPSGIPDTSYNPNFASLKQAYLTYAKAGSLNKITYPSGGSSVFEFDLHEYAKYVEDDQSLVNSITQSSIGGLRIKNITHHDGINSDIVKDYYYVSGYYNGATLSGLSSSGVIRLLPKFSIGPLTGTTDDNYNFTYTVKNSTPVLTSAINNGSSNVRVTYSEVVEKNNTNGYAITYFTNHDNGYLDLAPIAVVKRNKFFIAPTTDKEFERNKLYREKIFDNNNTLKKQLDIEYSRLGDSTLSYARSLFAIRAGFHGLGNAYFRAGAAVQLFYYKFWPTKKIEKLFTGSDTITTIAQLTYNSTYNLIAEQTTTNSKGETVKTKFIYPFDLTATGNVYQKMVNKNMLDYKVEQRDIIDISGEKVRSGTINEYSEPLTDIINVSKVKNVETAALLATSGFAATNYTSQLNYDSHYKDNVPSVIYNSYGQTVEIQKKDETLALLYQGMDHTKMVAGVRNATKDKIAYSSFENEYKGNLSYADYGESGGVTGRRCYNLAKGNITYTPSTSATYIISYWSNSGSYNVNSSSVTVTGPPINGWTFYAHEVTTGSAVTISGSGNIDEVRLYPKGAQMITYTYDPLTGFTSQCDASNHISSYEYDNLGRLTVVRDQYKNVIKKLCYNLLGETVGCIETFWNKTAASKVFIKNNCSSGWHGSPYTFTVAANTFSSTVSSYDADQKAQIYVLARGQDTANAFGWCNPDVVYAQLSYENTYYGSNYTTADVVIRFYSDEACTTPVSVTNFNVNVNKSDGSPDQTISCTGTYAVFEYNAYLYYETTDPIATYLIDYALSTGSGYIIIN